MRPKAFFYHYNKPRSQSLKKVQVSLHYDDKCHIVDNIICDVRTVGRIRKSQLLGYDWKGQVCCYQTKYSIY